MTILRIRRVVRGIQIISRIERPRCNGNGVGFVKKLWIRTGRRVPGSGDVGYQLMDRVTYFLNKTGRNKK